jgi:hypothetical protein
VSVVVGPVLPLAALDYAQFLTIALGTLGLIGLMSAAAAVARSSSVRQNLELLRGEVADLTASNARLDAENTALRTTTLRREQEITVLQDLVTSRTDVQQLIGELRGINQQLHEDYRTLIALFYRNPDDARVAQEARQQQADLRQDRPRS